MSQKVVFLDRDGTLNIDHGYVYRAEDWEFTDHAVEAVRALRTAGYAMAIVTNQSGIAAGYYREEDFWTLTDYMQAQLERSGARIDACVLSSRIK